jgi:hypothetical protein
MGNIPLFKKRSSKHSAKKAKGINWDNPGSFSDEDLLEIFDLKIENDFSQKLNKAEKIFIELQRI